MEPTPLLLLGAPSLAFRRSALRALAREMPAERVDRIWVETRRRRAELRKARPRHSFGVNHLLRYFEWDCALYSAARAEGVPAETAGLLVEEINWGIFGPAIELSFPISRLRSRRLRTRVKWIVDLMFRFLFTAPFERTERASKHDVTFDVTACPLADYFRDRGVPELTRYAACSLDHRMAAAWGVGFERRATIARGHARCDFRFRILPSAGLEPPRERPRAPLS